jgi:hypothetical protein
MDVYGRVWMAPAAGFEVSHNFLSVNVDSASVEPNTPSGTPRTMAFGFLAWLFVMCCNFKLCGADGVSDRQGRCPLSTSLVRGRDSNAAKTSATPSALALTTVFKSQG